MFNAAHDLVERNLRNGRGSHVAFIDDTERCTYLELARRVNRCSSALSSLGIRPEQRVLLCLQDTIDFPVAFLGCIQAGIVPVPVNTMLQTADYEFLLHDSRATALIVSASLWPQFAAIANRPPGLRHLVVSRCGTANGACADASLISFESLLASGNESFSPAATARDEPCFWLYSSGSTGRPKGTIHAHSSPIQTAHLYARSILGLRADDVVFSAPKLFFAYGLGNALTFPMSVGATSVLMAERPSPEPVFARLRNHQPTIFFGVPTLYASMLNGRMPSPAELALRLCVSAGEPLPRDLGERWVKHFGVDILDGIGSTEMLHIFISNRPGNVAYGTTGDAVPGYELRLVDENGHAVSNGQIGELQVSGPTAALGYWNDREKSHHTFQGRWTRTGDKYRRDEAGRYIHCGRSDDMLKVSGMYVSPTEIESALIGHPAVLETAVIGETNADGLVKPLACVVLRQPDAATPELAEQLKQYAKARLAPHKYPRRIEFLRELPKTATGKIQRYRLRDAFSPPSTPTRSV